MSVDSESLVMRTAKRHVQMYQDESDEMVQHERAIDCRDCEAFLQLGIDAFEWLMRADRSYRMAMYRGDTEHDPEVEAALERLCKAWLVPCDRAEQWIEKQISSGYQIDNLLEFRGRVAEMSAIVEALDDGSPEALPEGISRFRDEAIDEHINGETAEFI